MNAPDAAPSTQLLVVTPFEENAKRIESFLRNAGIKARVTWVAQAAVLEQLLRRAQPDLLLGSDHHPDIPLKMLVDLVRRFAPTVPVLALASQLDGDHTAAAVACGAQDLVADGTVDALAHLKRVVQRELHAQRNQRELAQARAQLAEYESRYAQLVRETGDAVAQLHEGIVAKVNPAFMRLLGHDDPAALEGAPLMDLIAPGHQAAARDHLRQLQQGRGAERPLQCMLLARDGAEVSICAQLRTGEQEGERYVELIIAAQAVAAPASEPPLTLMMAPVSPAPSTGAGRIEFFNRLEAPAGDASPRAALFVAVDRAAALEERVGFFEFEQIMRQVQDLLRRQLGDDGEVFRFATHEFAVLATRADAAHFEPLARELVRTLGGFVFGTRHHESQLSLSLAVYPLGGSDEPAQVMKELSAQARRLSLQGGNDCVVLGPTARAEVEEQEIQRRAAGIRKALDENRFKLAYQTIASLEGESREHFDVFLRMVNEQGEEQHAADFIGTAARGGLLPEIDRWVVTRVVRTLATREAHKQGSMLFVKLSEDSLKDAEGFLGWLLPMLREKRLRADELCFEVPETVLQNHIRKARLLAAALRKDGVGLAIEHFGVGTASAQLLEHLPVSFLKFHMSFTANFGEKDVNRRMTELMELAKRRQIKTIVSHVEDANVMAQMWQMGVNYIQGYHVQEPEVVTLG